MSEAKTKSHAEIIERIKKFLSMTVERGAGEAEALFAAKKAAELMAQYDISLADLQDRPTGSGAVYKRHYFDAEFSRYVFQIVRAISQLCHVRILISGPGDKRVSIVGLELDVEIAGYLLDLCIVAMTNEVEKASRLWRLQIHHMARKRSSFLQGLTDRLKERLDELAWARSRSGNALVVITDEIVADVLKRHGVKTSEQTIRGRFGDQDSLQKGRKAGNNIALNNALGSRSGNAAGSLGPSDE
jgi:predicted transcriptional regulator